MRYPLLLLCLLCSPCFADFPIEQVTLVRASSAEIVQEKDSVLVIAKDLKLTPIYGVRLTVPESKYIQVYNVVVVNGQPFASFPPRIYESTDGKYLVLGKPGDRLGISIPSPTGPPVYQETTIAPSTTPPPEEPQPPPVGFEKLKLLSKDLADKVNDPQTRQKLAAAYKSVLSVEKSFDQLTSDIVAARQLVLNARPRPVTTNWEPWKLAIEEELKRLVPANDVKTYVAAFEAVIAGLTQS